MDEPYTRIPIRIIRSTKLSAVDKAVYLAIASCGEEAFPSYEQIAEWACISRRQVSLCLKVLVETKALERVKDGRHNRYRVYTSPGSEQFHEAKKLNASQGTGQPLPCSTHHKGNGCLQPGQPLPSNQGNHCPLIRFKEIDSLKNENEPDGFVSESDEAERERAKAAIRAMFGPFPWTEPDP